MPRREEAGRTWEGEGKNQKGVGEGENRTVNRMNFMEMNINLVSQLLCYRLQQGKFTSLLPFCLCHLVAPGGLHYHTGGLKRT